MTAPNSFPGPRSNMTAAGMYDRIDAITSSDVVYALGDYTGGASENLFTLTAHGLVNGDVLHVLYQTAMGAALNGQGTRYVAKVLSSSTFQLTTDGTTVATNTADGSVLFLKGDVPDAVVQILVIPNIIHAAWDFTGGAAEDIGVPAQGTRGLKEADPIKLLYKSAAGVGPALDATVYAKAPTVTYFQFAATAGGAVVDTTADGTAIYLKIG